MADITAIILTKNEEKNILRCIKSIKNIVKRIVVVDSGSTDRTVELAKSEGAEIYFHPFEHYAAQFNWALCSTDITTKWVYRIDADEMITEALAKEIEEKCACHTDDDVTGFLMKHKLYFMGKYLLHGGAYPMIKMTVFKPEAGRFENRAMGEHIVLDYGKYLTFENDCIHYDSKSLTAFVDKHNSYASREVSDYYARQNKARVCEGLYKRAGVTESLRDKVYYKLPKYLRAKLFYIYNYYFRLGFLDGEAGKVYAFLQSYFYRFLVDAKLSESQLREEGIE